MATIDLARFLKAIRCFDRNLEKYYIANITHRPFHTRTLRKRFRTASAAISYGKAVASRYNRLLRAHAASQVPLEPDGFPP